MRDECRGFRSSRRQGWWGSGRQWRAPSRLLASTRNRALRPPKRGTRRQGQGQPGVADLGAPLIWLDETSTIVVTIIGVDAYNSGVNTQAKRWEILYYKPDGIAALAAFARLHHKRMSIPDWGLGPLQQPGYGQGGDDPAYVDGIAGGVAQDNVAYQAYFDAGLEGVQFQDSGQHCCLSEILRRGRGRGGLGPAPRVSRMPCDVVFARRNGWASEWRDCHQQHRGVQIQSAARVCALLRCGRRAVAAVLDIVHNLSPGFHSWGVTIRGQAADVADAGRTLVVAPLTRDR